jgi:long-chain acyl-CoA synthetase
MNIGTVLPRHAAFRPDHTAIIFEDQRLTYRQLHQSVNRVSNALSAAGIRKGDKVATLLSNCLELYEIYWAVAQIGAVVVPLSPLLRRQALGNLLNNSDARLVIVQQKMEPHLEEILPRLSSIKPEDVWVVDEKRKKGFSNYHDHKELSSDMPPPSVEIGRDDLYNIIYSSGTTGAPKGIMHTHFIRAMYMSLFSNYFRIYPESIILHTGSIIFNGSFLTLMPAMFLGATYILHPQFDVEKLVQTIREEKVTHTILVPSQIIQVLQHPDFQGEQISSLEMIMSVGAPLHKKYKEELDRRIPGVFYELYGLTEGFVTILDKNDFYAKTGSVGVPPALFEMKIVDEEGREVPQGEVGEIVGRGPILMSGYYKKPELTEQAVKDGWLYSGDLGYVDEEGFLYLAGRKKDLIISGGVNVYPKDIEAIMVQHEGIKEVAVFGAPHHKWGETPIAAVVPKPGFQLDKTALIEWTNERVNARFQKISDVLFLEDFPRNVAGKTLKRVIKEGYLNNGSHG